MLRPSAAPLQMLSPPINRRPAPRHRGHNRVLTTERPATPQVDRWRASLSHQRLQRSAPDPDRVGEVHPLQRIDLRRHSRLCPARCRRRRRSPSQQPCPTCAARRQLSPAPPPALESERRISRNIWQRKHASWRACLPSDAHVHCRCCRCFALHPCCHPSTSQGVRPGACGHGRHCCAGGALSTEAGGHPGSHQVSRLARLITDSPQPVGLHKRLSCMISSHPLRQKYPDADVVKGPLMDFGDPTSIR